MTCGRAHRDDGEAAQDLECAAVGAGVLPESAVANLQGFFKIAAPRGGARPVGLTSVGLVRLDGPAVSPQGLEASPAGDDSLAALREPKARKFPRYLKALNVPAVDAFEADAERCLRECWKFFENIPIGLVEPMAQGGDPVAQSGESPTSHLDQIEESAPRRKGLTGQGVRIGLLDTGTDTSRLEGRGEHVSLMEFEPQGFPIRSSPCPNGLHGSHLAGLAAGQVCGFVPAADLAVAATLASGSSGTPAQSLAGHNRPVPHNHAPPNGSLSSCSIINAAPGTVGYRPYLYSSARPARHLDRSLQIATSGNSGHQGVGSQRSPGKGRHRSRIRIRRFDRDREAFQLMGLVPSHGCWKADLCAPGEDVWNSLPREIYGPMPGTSMFVPVLAGTAVLLVQLRFAGIAWSLPACCQISAKLSRGRNRNVNSLPTVIEEP